MIRRPLISEKTMILAKQGFYTFEIEPWATKLEVAKKITEKFKVDVLSIQIVNKTGKTKMQRSRKGFYKAPDLKKAVVKVGKDQKIALFETAANPEEEKAEAEVRTIEGEAVTKIKEKKSLLRGTKVKIEKEEKRS